VAAARLSRRARLEIVKKSDAPGFTVLPRRRVVERTHASLSRYRRLARDYEVKTSHSEAFTYIASCSLLARRLGKSNLK
jgi:putative transposase